MNDRWRKTESAFLAIRDADPSDRPRLIDQHCADNADMRRELLEMLDSEKRMGEFLEDRAFHGAADPTRPGAADQFVGRRIDRYEIHRLIGAGGMGVVFEVSRGGSPARYALKLLQSPSSVTGRPSRAWEHEVAMLSRLDHPCIARFIDAGVTDDDAPYIVMEFVDGVPLDRFEWPATATLHDRIRLLLRICDAVSHGHQRGVIHRDLKPTNILVTHPAGGDVPDVKIVDFGLAMPQAPANENELSYSMTVARRGAGTLAYMSPERIRDPGCQADVRGDVYALGAVFYECLVGRRPHDLTDLSYAQAARCICERDIDRPARHRRELRGDPEAILLKALSRNSQERYQSVDQLADDLRCLLERRPVAARRAGISYDVRRFIARHKAASAAASIALVSLVGIAVWMGVLYQRAEAAERIARHEANVSKEAMTLLLWVFTVGGPSHGPPGDVTIHDAMRMLIGELDRLEFDPLIEAEMRHKIGVSLMERGEYPEAERNLEIAERLVRETSGSNVVQAANCQVALSQVRIQQGSMTEAEPLRRAIESLRRSSDTDAWVGPELGSALQTLAGMHFRRDEFAEAEKLTREALQCYGESTSRLDARKVIGVQDTLGRILDSQKRYDEANAVYDAALNEAKSILPPDDTLIATLNLRLSCRYRREKNHQLAGEYIDQAIRIYELRLPANHPSTADAYMQRGHLFRAQDRYLDAAYDYERARSMLAATYGLSERSVLNATYSVATCAEAVGRIDDAIKLYSFVTDQTKERYPHRTETIRRYEEALHRALVKRDSEESIIKRDAIALP